MTEFQIQEMMDVEREEPETLELKVVSDEPDSKKCIETVPLVTIPRDNEIMDLEGDNSVGTRGQETQEAVIGEPDFSSSSETEPLVTDPSVTILTENRTFYVGPERTDKKYRKIVDIFKKQSLAEAFKEQLNTFKRQATWCFKKKQRGTDEADSANLNAGEISVETMKFAIRCLHATQNPFHAFMNVLRVKEGNKEKLIAELEKIETKRDGFISRDTFREYIAVKKEEKTHLNWWHCCDGDPEDKPPTGTLIDYFSAIARAQKVKTNPLVALFPLFALLLLLIHTQSSDTFKKQLSFDV